MLKPKKQQKDKTSMYKLYMESGNNFLYPIALSIKKQNFSKVLTSPVTASKDSELVFINLCHKATKSRLYFLFKFNESPIC